MFGLTVEQTTLLLSVTLGPALAYLAYRQSKKVENRSAQSALIESIISNLQEDNKALREELKYEQTRIDALESKIDQLKLELIRMQRKYGENGPDNAV